jgi:DnaK suppressor protein
MKKAKLEHYKKKLLKNHKEFIKKFSKTKGDTKETTRDGTEDYIDYAVNSYTKEFLLSLTEIDRKQLVLIEEALKRIQNGRYAKCQQCFKEVSTKRLEAAPWARHCVKCQELEEQGLLPHYSFRQNKDGSLEYEDLGDAGFLQSEEGKTELDFETESKSYKKQKMKGGLLNEDDEEE